MAFLEVEELTLDYATPRGPLRSVDAVSFSVEKAGTGLGLIGETGSGKSSLVMAMARILPRNVEHYSGKVVLDGNEIMGLSNDEYRRRGRWKQISVVFQGSMNGFNPVLKVWLEQGGIYALANLRGGGEYGDDWHRQGMLAKKQNVFDDFYAVMRYLVEAGYTQVSKLAIEGGSNGGLLMGAMITQHPHDFQAVISHVGIYDSLRSELSPNGAFNIPEFGSVKDPGMFKALYAYSPYHHVHKTAYPAILFMTGENDGRVDPMHSRKMTAALQYANTSGKPILLRTSGNTGHGAGTPLDETIAQQVDRLVFLFDSLGMQYQTVSN